MASRFGFLLQQLAPQATNIAFRAQPLVIRNTFSNVFLNTTSSPFTLATTPSAQLRLLATAAKKTPAKPIAAPKAAAPKAKDAKAVKAKTADKKPATPQKAAPAQEKAKAKDSKATKAKAPAAKPLQKPKEKAAKPKAEGKDKKKAAEKDKTKEAAAKEKERAQKEKEKAKIAAEKQKAKEKAAKEKEKIAAEKQKAKEKAQKEKEKALAKKEKEKALALAKREKEKAKEAARIKRAPSAFNLFVKSSFPALKAQQPGKSAPEYLQVLTKNWANLADLAKERFISEARTLAEKVQQARQQNKKPAKGFALFVKENFRSAQEKNPNQTATDIIKALGERFKALPSSEKAKYLLKSA